jgi:hypothetical protein
MSHFFGTLSNLGSTNRVTRTGSMKTGLRAEVMTYSARIIVRVWTIDGVDHYDVILAPHPLQDDGRRTALACGVLDLEADETRK